MEVQFSSFSDKELVELIREDETLAFDELMKRYKSTIYSIAGKIFRGKQNIGWASSVEAIEEGKAGLSMAVLNYNPEKKVVFENYAKVTIKGYILNYINENKSLVISHSIQRTLNKVIKVASELQSSTYYNKDKSLIDFIQNNEDSIKEILHKRHPELDWVAFRGKCLHILNIGYESSLDQTKEDENGEKSALHEIIPSKVPSPLKNIEDKEAGVVFRNIYKKGMHEIINKYSQGKKNNILKDILERYYIRGEEESSLINSLNKSGYIRQIKSRFKREICRDHLNLIEAIVKELNDYFDFTYIGSENPFCDDFINLCEAVIKSGLLKEDES